MKKVLYVGNLKFDHVVNPKTSKHTYKYLPITKFLQKAEALGLQVDDWEYDKKAFLPQTKYVYKVIFRYRFRDRKAFRVKLLQLADSHIAEYFVIRDKPVA